MSLPTIIEKLADQLADMEGVGRMHPDPPENINEFPAVMIYSRDGQLTNVSNGMQRNLHTIVVDVYNNRQILPEAIDAAKEWPARFMTALLTDVSIGGSVDGINFPVEYRTGPLAYGNNVHFGVRFELTVKEIA